MIIIDATTTRASNRLLLWIPKQGNCKSGDWAPRGSGEVLP
jgi:hypothetical protein